MITTTATNYGTPDNYGNFLNVSTTVTDADSGSPYYNQQWKTATATTIAPDNSGNWCLNLPTEVDVTNTVPPGSGSQYVITRHTSFVNLDYAHCRQNEQVIESGNTSYQVDTKLYYDGFGNPSSQTVTGAGGMAARSTSVGWGTSGQFPTTQQNALGQTTQFLFDPNSGKPLSVTDPNGIQTSWQYDTFGRKNKQINPDGTYTIWTYNDCATWGGSNGCLYGTHTIAVGHTLYTTAGGVTNSGSDWLDQFDRPLFSNAMNIASTFDRTEQRYDNMGNVSQQAMPCAYTAPLTACPYWTTLTHDALNRLTQSARPISATVSTLQTTNIAYTGRTTVVTDPQNKKTTTVTKVTGKLGRTQDHNNYYVSFDHDAFGAVLSAKDSLSNTLSTATYAYGIKAFKLTSTDMDLGSRSYTVDALGEITASTDAKSQSFSTSYDALSRPQVRTEPDLTTTWTWGTSATSYNIGRLASVKSVASVGTYSETYTYSSHGQLTDEKLTIPGYTTVAFDYGYSSTTGLMQTLIYPEEQSPGNFRVTAGYQYKNGILQQIVDDANTSTIWWQANTINPRGQITQETTEDLSGDPKIVSNRAFDAVTGWVSTIQSGVGGGSALQNESYTYDYLGNVTDRQNNNLGLTETFNYDNLYRLANSLLGSTTNLTMGYDAMGNITSRTDVAGGATWTYDPVHKHQVTQTGTGGYAYQYDPNGNAISRNGSIIGWTSYNYPSSVATSSESATFDYGPRRQRWRMVYNGSAGQETTYYATPKFEAVVTSAGTDSRHYIYAGSRPVVVVSRTTAGAVTVRSLLVDHQGSISSIITDSTGTNDVNESFTAYGNRREASNWNGAPTSGELTTMNGVTRQGYTFQTVLGSMGLNHMNGRIEDSVTGRFLSADPHVNDKTNSQDFNRYSYVRNNPLSLVDPSGFMPHLLCNSGDCIESDTATMDEIDVEAPPSSGANFSTAPDAAVTNGSVNTPGSGTGDGPLDSITVMGHRNSPSTVPVSLTQIPSITVTAQCVMVAPTGQYQTANGVDARFDPTTAQMLSDALTNLNQQGIVPVITSGYRSPSQQNSLTTNNSPFVITPAQVSWHEVGAAVDFGPNTNAGNFPAIQAAMTQAGFVWGGNFHTPDIPHFQSQPSGTSPTAAMVQACASSP